MKNSIITSVLVGALGLVVAPSASAIVLMLDFGANPNGAPTGNTADASPYHTVAGAGFTDTSWNQVRLADINSGLVYSNNTAATGVSVNLGRNSTTDTIINLSSQPVSELAGSATTTGVYAGNSAARDGIFGTTTTNPRIGLQVGGLTAGTYDVYITARNTNTGDGQAAYDQIIYAGSSASGNFNFGSYSNSTLTYPGSSSQTTTFVSSWVAGENYVKLTVSVASGEYLNIAVAGDGTNRGFLNSVQIVSAIPEPSTYAAIGGLTVLGLATLRRRRD
ncbi:PEP-CTERM sorting domain-containing protein [Rariglobus hedericola]|uniref:PEP-CTERM sorting domain-containing protein n=1 Tax=Rariglobus hedericola TaxID=2597822 RepID=A0A556QRP4_9BACT|nr:PEP-CTERM sorting domain-containing protein [Rariglobus hedericola]TSJ79301.1 PEP-CTERM sorting domain-containing protein [Rariglobus hedericola]